MLSVWWDFEGIIYYELLRPNTTIDSKLYCSKFEGCNKQIVQTTVHDNAKPHTCAKSRKNLGGSNPPYSPDLAPSDITTQSSGQKTVR